MVSVTHYDTLEVTESASDEVIKGAYRFLSQKWHPDKNPQQREGSERAMRAINDAYAVLSDPARRREYDAWLARQRTDSGTRSGGGKPAPEPVSERDHYIKAMSTISAEPVGAIFFFVFCAASVAIASVASGFRDAFFSRHPLQFMMILLIINGITEYALSSRRKRSLAQVETGDLSQMYGQYQRKKHANLALTWLWIILGLTVLFAYRSTAQDLALTKTSLNTPAPLLVHNGCKLPVTLAVNYLGANQQWLTEGIFTVQPGISSRLVLNAQSGELVQSVSGRFYFYARSADNGYLWAGDEANPEHKSVAMENRTLRFRSVQLQRNDQNAFVLSLTCDNGG